MIKIFTSIGRKSDCLGFLINPDGTIDENFTEPESFIGLERFDVAEFIQTYGKLDDEIDILDIGYWYDGGKYEPAEAEFRLEQRRNQAVK